MSNVIVVIGPGLIGQAIARRVGVGKHVLLADLREDNANAAPEVLDNARYEVSVATVDASSREAVQALVATATGLGEVTGLIHAAGVSPSQAPPSMILKVDLYGTALVLEEFGSIIASGGAGVVIASQSGHRLPPLTLEQDEALATTPVEEPSGPRSSAPTEAAATPLAISRPVSDEAVGQRRRQEARLLAPPNRDSLSRGRTYRGS